MPVGPKSLRPQAALYALVCGAAFRPECSPRSRCPPTKLSTKEIDSLSAVILTNQNIKETMVLKRAIGGQTGTSAEKLKSVENLNLGTNRNTGKLQLNLAANKQGVK